MDADIATPSVGATSCDACENSDFQIIDLMGDLFGNPPILIISFVFVEAILCANVVGPVNILTINTSGLCLFR